MPVSVSLEVEQPSQDNNNVSDVQEQVKTWDIFLCMDSTYLLITWFFLIGQKDKDVVYAANTFAWFNVKSKRIVKEVIEQNKLLAYVKKLLTEAYHNESACGPLGLPNWSEYNKCANNLKIGKDNTFFCFWNCFFF